MSSIITCNHNFNIYIENKNKGDYIIDIFLKRMFEGDIINITLIVRMGLNNVLHDKLDESLKFNLYHISQEINSLSDIRLSVT